MEHPPSIIITALAAFLLPLGAARLRLPAVVVEILFGIVAGPWGLDWIRESTVMNYLAELGFLLLMFLSGFEIDFGTLERQGLVRLATGLTVFGLTLYLAYLGAGYLGHGPFVMLLLATTSVGLVVPTLRNARRISTPLGQTVLISALLADFLTLVGVTLFAMVREHGMNWSLMKFPALLGIIVLALLALKRFAWWYPEKFSRLFDAQDPEEMGIRTCLALMFVFVGLSYLLDVEAILGAFLAGSVFALVFRHREGLEQKLKGFSYGFLIPIFFIHVGLLFDLRVMVEPGVIAGAAGLLVAALVVKFLPASVLFLRGFGPREVLAAGALLSARLSLVIAVATLGVRLGFLDRVLESQVIVLAIVTSMAAPAAFRALAPPLPAPTARGA
jgi:Kef-type K+ transport system membrane component KefB